MRRTASSLFPTRVITGLALVLIFGLVLCKTNPVWGANASPSPDFVDVPPVERPPTEEQKQIGASLDIAPEPPVAPNAVRKLGYFHKYRHGLSANFYEAYDSKIAADGGSFLTRATVLYLFNDQALHYYEAGADLLSDGSGALSIARRWIYTRTRFRPFTKAGAAVRINPSDELGTFLKLEHYQVRASAGFEQLIRNPVSLRFEVEATASMRSVQGLAGLGVVWSW